MGSGMGQAHVQDGMPSERRQALEMLPEGLQVKTRHSDRVQLPAHAKRGGSA